MKRPIGLRAGIPIIALAALVAACSGGGSGTHATVPGSGAGASVAGKAVLTIPNRTASSAKRTPKFVSASAVSVAVSINGGTPTYTDVSTSSTACTSSASGRTCTIPLNAPAGSDTFTFSLYDQANGAGNLLGTGSVSQTVGNSAFTLAVSIGGVVASLVITVPVIDYGPTSVPVTATAKDADGNTIIGPVPYTTPITLTNSDTTGTLTLSTTTVISPTTPVTLTYTGGALTSAATISATLSGLASSAITPASVLPLNYFPTNLSRNYTVTSSSTTTTIAYGSSPSPSATSTTIPNSATATEIITGGASFDGQTNAQSFIVQGTINPEAMFPPFNDESGTEYQAILNGVFSALGGASSSDYETGTEVFPNGAPLAGLPFVPGATLSGMPMYTGNATATYPITFGIAGYTTTYGRDSTGNFDTTETYEDGSTYVEHDNTDGSASVAYAPGTALPSSSPSAWDNGLPTGLSAASATYAAPSGGTIAVNASQTTTGGTQTSSQLAIPVSVVYPNGYPTTFYSISSTVGTPLTTLPSACTIPSSIAGPFIPLTVTGTTWYPAGFDAFPGFVYVNYFAPSVGLVCATLTETQTNVGFQDFALSTFPLTLANANLDVNEFAYTETDVLTAIGSVGSVTVNGHARALRTMGPRTGFGHRFRMPSALRSNGGNIR